MSPKPLRREEGVIKGPEPLQLGVLALLGGEEGRGGSEEAGLGEVLGGAQGLGHKGRGEGQTLSSRALASCGGLC